MEEERKELTNQELENASGGETTPECPKGRSYPCKSCLSANCQYCTNYRCMVFNRTVPSGKTKVIVD